MKPATFDSTSTPTPVPSKASQRPVTTASGNHRTSGRWWFLVLCFGWSWMALLVARLVGASLEHPVVQLLTVAMVPALTALVVRLFITREGFADAGLRPRLRTSWRYYLAALLIPVGVLIVGTLLAFLIGAWRPGQGAAPPEVAVQAMTGMVLAITMTPLFWGEEFGWTAYMRDRLLPGRPLATTFLTGLIWGVWHFPLPWVGYFGDADPARLLGSMLLWVPLSVLLEHLIGWLWARTESVWPGAMLHAGCNLGAALGLEKILAGRIGILEQTVLYCCALTPFVIWVVARDRIRSRNG